MSEEEEKSQTLDEDEEDDDEDDDIICRDIINMDVIQKIDAEVKKLCKNM